MCESRAGVREGLFHLASSHPIETGPIPKSYLPTDSSSVKNQDAKLLCWSKSDRSWKESNRTLSPSRTWRKFDCKVMSLSYMLETQAMVSKIQKANIHIRSVPANRHKPCDSTTVRRTLEISNSSLAFSIAIAKPRHFCGLVTAMPSSMISRSLGEHSVLA